MAEMMKGEPPPVPRVPAKKALFLLLMGIGAALVGIAFGLKALAAPHLAAQLGRTAASLAGGGVFVAALGAPALKRQSLAREALAAFAIRRGFALPRPDEARGTIDDVAVGVRIAYGSGPYGSRGASEILVHVRPAGGDPSFMTDSEPFDDAAVVAKHLDRLTDRAMRKVRPPTDADEIAS